MMLDPAGSRVVEEETRWQPPEFSGRELTRSRRPKPDPETSSAQAHSLASPASARYM